MEGLDAARREELIQRLSGQLRAWNLREPAIVILSMHAPLAFFGSQLLLVAQPFLRGWMGDRMAHDLVLLLEDPQNIELLAARLSE